MRFKVSRCSTPDASRFRSKPCPGAFRDWGIRVDHRGWKTEREHDERAAANGWKKWREEGTNHRKIKGGIARDLRERFWFVEVKTARELVALQAAIGAPLQIEDDGLGGGPEIYFRDAEWD